MMWTLHPQLVGYAFVLSLHSSLWYCFHYHTTLLVFFGFIPYICWHMASDYLPGVCMDIWYVWSEVDTLLWVCIVAYCCDIFYFFILSFNFLFSINITPFVKNKTKKTLVKCNTVSILTGSIEADCAAGTGWLNSSWPHSQYTIQIFKATFFLTHLVSIWYCKRQILGETLVLLTFTIMIIKYGKL